MQPDNSRNAIEADLDFCAYCPGEPSIGWRDVAEEDGTKSTVGVCLACAATIGGSADGVAFVPISDGAPCRCGPGFCANSHGVGFFGYCAGSRSTSGPDCVHCGAGHQSDAGCWLCRGPSSEPWEVENSKAWLRMLSAGVTGHEVFDEQERNGNMQTFEEAADAVIARKGA